jgi:hypothetical protein
MLGALPTCMTIKLNVDGAFKSFVAWPLRSNSLVKSFVAWPLRSNSLVRLTNRKAPQLGSCKQHGTTVAIDFLPIPPIPKGHPYTFGFLFDSFTQGSLQVVLVAYILTSYKKGIQRMSSWCWEGVHVYTHVHVASATNRKGWLTINSVSKTKSTYVL